jgi:8-hydroxy-5-deazaflavin:NADPH oxidoreductase
MPEGTANDCGPLEINERKIREHEMRIAVLGAGNVGAALGIGWAHKGHEVMFGSRNPLDAKIAGVVAKAGGRSKAGTLAEAVAVSEVSVLATPWKASESVIKSCRDWNGKILLDCTNPLKPDLSNLELGLATSGGEQVARWAAGAHVVKVFNTTGFNNMVNANYGGVAATMFYCGDIAASKAVAAQLAADLGFDPVDVGPLDRARLLEPLALLWIRLAIERGSRDIAFKLMKR